MNPLQIEIEEKSTLYDIEAEYHSELLSENMSASMEGVAESDNRITLRPKNGYDAFRFNHSDPDTVIAVANMMLSFAQMVKKESNKTLDPNANAC